MACLKKRGEKYYAQYYVAGRQKRVGLDTDSYQLAKEKLRKVESALLRGSAMPLPTKTPIAEILSAYVAYMPTHKTARSVRADTFYLREMFGPICPALHNTAERQAAAQERPLPPRRQGARIEVNYLEHITTADIASFLTAQVRARGLAPKTANRYREIICRLFNWSMKQRGVKTPDNLNPATQVERYKEHAPQITFLTLHQIDEQLKAIESKPQLQTMVALYIYAGLRREEALWLTVDDLDLKAGLHGMIRVRAKTVDGDAWQPKTGVNRVVPVSRALRGHLDRYFPRPRSSRWYFPSPEGTRWDADNFSADLRAANTQAGLSWACLEYRHTFGSQLAMRGESLYKIATLMGNSPEICRRHYAALLPECLEATVEFTADAQTGVNHSRATGRRGRPLVP
jgi:integrase